MQSNSEHTFHIPVMGLGFTLDTPLKVARWGISSVISIVEDGIIEVMRGHYLRTQGKEYVPISDKEDDYRARRITAYIDLIGDIVGQQMEALTMQDFGIGAEIDTYFELLPDSAPLKQEYCAMLALAEGDEKTRLQEALREKIAAGRIEVNIMTKLDRAKYADNGEAMPPEFSDALAALRGFAKSSTKGGIVLSAGMNPRLYSYVTEFDDFFPTPESGIPAKSIILKVSDFRSASIQGKLLAKKGVWISEFRVESGLNCGGHAFVSEGALMGPVLEDFSAKKEELRAELLDICNAALAAQDKALLDKDIRQELTAQGGIGTAEEDAMLRTRYKVDRTGWGSPFLLVPEVTSLDDKTLEDLAGAVPDDYYISDASPLGVLFNNFKKSSSHALMEERNQKGRPGSPCYKKFLAFNTEFTEQPICTASRQYQHLKIQQLEERNLSPEEHEEQLKAITVKECLCEGLGASILLKNNIKPPRGLDAVSICPGPNLAYFSGVFSLQEMVGHIYGRTSLLNNVPRPHVFVNELKLNVLHLQKAIDKGVERLSKKEIKSLIQFHTNLCEGIQYYRDIVATLGINQQAQRLFLADIYELEQTLADLAIVHGTA